jgi:hypothetical protein
MKIELTVFKSNADKYSVKVTTSVTNGSIKPKSKELTADETCDFIKQVIVDLDEKGKIGTR